MAIGKTEYLGAFFSVAILAVSTAQSAPPPQAINTLGQLQCAAGEAALYDGTNWICSDITARLDALEAENQALKDRLACVTSTSNATDFVFEGCNVHVRNGVGQTESINGAGNLIVGYDEERLPENSSCSLGRYWDTQTDCEAAGGTWWVNNKTGSHNVVIGPEHNYSSYGGFVAGDENTISGEYASVSGGVQNTASVPWSSVSGGPITPRAAKETPASAVGRVTPPYVKIQASAGGKETLPMGLLPASAGVQIITPAGSTPASVGAMDASLVLRMAGALVIPILLPQDASTPTCHHLLKAILRSINGGLRVAVSVYAQVRVWPIFSVADTIDTPDSCVS